MSRRPRHFGGRWHGANQCRCPCRGHSRESSRTTKAHLVAEWASCRMMACHGKRCSEALTSRSAAEAGVASAMKATAPSKTFFILEPNSGATSFTIYGAGLPCVGLLHQLPRLVVGRQGC